MEENPIIKLPVERIDVVRCPKCMAYVGHILDKKWFKIGIMVMEAMNIKIFECLLCFHGVPIKERLRDG